MKPSSFYYHSPTTLDEAVAILAEVAREDGRILAGGQSLVPTMAFRIAQPRHLIDINGIEALRKLEVRNGKLFIGACVRHSAFHRPVITNRLAHLLAGVAQHIAHLPIRNRGTFCGSIANADPASEWCLVAACLDAEMIAQSSRGIRVIPAREFFNGIMTTALQEDELLTEVRLPLLADDARFGFYEFSRRTGDFAVAMALAVYGLTDGKVVEPRIAVGGVEPNPRRMLEAERELSGRKPDQDTIVAVANQAVLGIADPMADAVFSAEYRLDLVRTVTRRALEQSLA